LGLSGGTAGPDSAGMMDALGWAFSGALARAAAAG